MPMFNSHRFFSIRYGNMQQLDNDVHKKGIISNDIKL